MNAQNELISHVKDLADRCFTHSHYTFTDFLSQGEQSDILQFERELQYVPFSFFGGAEGCERRMLRFGSEEMLGYSEAFPVKCLKVSPLMEKFSDELTHRDFLGALMNLQVERSVIGDIVVRGRTAYIFCEEKMADFLCEELTRVKHTSVKCELCEDTPDEVKPQYADIELNLPSGRCDAVIAGLFKLSRSKSQELFKNGSIFINGRLCENSSAMLKEGAVVSVRGFGKFIYDGELGETRKGRLRVSVRKYI